jgi:ferredoxin-NADP reductase
MATEAVLMADQKSKLIRREEVAEGKIAFHFERTSGFAFKAGQSADVTLIDPPDTDTEGNTRTFSIASPPFENELVFTTRMRDTAFKRSVKNVPLAMEVKIGSAAGSFTLHKNPAKPAVFLGTVLSLDDRFAQPRFERSDYDFSSGEPLGDREYTD